MYRYYTRFGELTLIIHGESHGQDTETFILWLPST